MTERNWGRRMAWVAWLAAGVALGAGAGCKEKRAAEREPAAEATSRPELEDAAATRPGRAARPTTRELTSGPRKAIPLEFVPLTAIVPEGWKIDNLAGSMMVLTGPTPGGEVQVQLLNEPSMPADRLEYLLAAAKKEPAGDPKVKLVEVRRLGAATLLERQVVGQTVVTPVLDERGRPSVDANGKELTTPITPFRWTLTLFAPKDGKELAVYELQFVNLTLQQYEADKTFLRGIVDGLRYGAEAGTKPATEPVTEPATSPGA